MESFSLSQEPIFLKVSYLPVTPAYDTRPADSQKIMSIYFSRKGLFEEKVHKALLLQTHFSIWQRVIAALPIRTAYKVQHIAQSKEGPIKRKGAEYLKSCMENARDAFRHYYNVIANRTPSST